MFNKSAAIELYKQYSLGKRQFHKAQLARAELGEKSLSLIDLREADLSYANLKNTDLSDADLRDASLISVELSGANLSRANLAAADLSSANLSRAKLIDTNLTGACLHKAFLADAQLIKVDLSYANLTGSFLLGVELSNVNLNGAIYDRNTTFTFDFEPVRAGMIQQYTIEELLAQFNHLYKCSNRYLGSTMTAKYFFSSRPEFDWLNQFAINQSNQIIFEGVLDDVVSPIQLNWFQKWINNFIQSCSQIIKDFAQLIEQNN